MSKEIGKILASLNQSLKVQCGLTARNMAALSKFMKKNVNVLMTSRRILQKTKNQRCPPVNDIRTVTAIKSPGVYTTLNDSLKQTVTEFSELGDILPPPPTDGSLLQLRLTLKDGMDGAGNQLKIKGQSSASMETMGYVVLEVHDITNPESPPKLLWRNPAPNSRYSFKPLCLVLEKESETLAAELIKLYPEKVDGFQTKLNGQDVRILPKIKRTMLDGKMRSIVSGRGGAFCSTCNQTAGSYYAKVSKYRVDPLSSDILYSTYEELSSYYDRKGAGRLHMKSGLRAGFTHKPLGSIESMTVLHSYINICRWFLKGMAISESSLNKDLLKPTKRFSEEQNAVWKKEKRRLCGEILEKLKIRTMEIGRNNTGSGLTGGEAKKFFENSDKVCALLKNSEDRPKWLYLMSRMNFVLSALNSNVKIHVEPFRIYTRLITDFIVRNIKWFRIIPTLHTVLSHGWEWVQRNDGHGLLALSEEAIEAVQGVARNIRKFRCFQGNVMTNLRQCLEQLQLQSDMVLNQDYFASTKNKKKNIQKSWRTDPYIDFDVTKETSRRAKKTQKS